MTDLTTEQLRWVCAMLEQECPRHYLGITDPGYPPVHHSPDCKGGCKGTGRIPLLEGVQEKCEWCKGTGKSLVSVGECHWCYGLGWTPTKNLVKWLEAGTVLGIVRVDLLYTLEKWYVALEHGGDAYSGVSILDALHSALYQTLLPLAINSKTTEEDQP